MSDLANYKQASLAPGPNATRASPFPFSIVDVSRETSLAARDRKISGLGDRNEVFVGFIAVADACSILLSAVFAHLIRYETPILPPSHWMTAIIAVFVFGNLMTAAGCYRVEEMRLRSSQFNKIVACWIAVACGIVALLYAAKASDTFSRIWVTLWFVSGLGAFACTRAVVETIVGRYRADGKLTTNVAIVGTQRSGSQLAQMLVGADSRAFTVVSMLVIERRHIADPRSAEMIADRICAMARGTRLDEVIIAVPGASSTGLRKLVRRLTSISASVWVCPHVSATRMPSGRLTVLGDIPMFSVLDRPLGSWDRIVKRAEDVVLSSLLLLALLPAMGLVALAIRLESEGPILFRQARFGFNNNLINVLKFRSMYVTHCADPSARQARRDDDRVTRVGRWIRRASLDELPQLFNVLKGDMSLVGPRPHPVALNERFADRIDNYLARHRVRPGITGWAQVNGLRGETDTVEKMRARVNHDLYYIEHWSLLFDFKILLLTAAKGLIHTNAY